MYWSRCQGQELDFSIATHFFVKENVEREFKWLDDTVEFYGIIVDPSLDHLLLQDRHACFHETFRLHVD